MVLLTVPVFFPVVVSLGVDPVWFGILMVPTPTLFRGVAPFVVADVVRLVIPTLFPVISLWLPSALRIAGQRH